MPAPPERISEYDYKSCDKWYNTAEIGPPHSVSNRVEWGVASSTLPHHRTYGSVYGGSLKCCYLTASTLRNNDSKPQLSKNFFRKASFKWDAPELNHQPCPVNADSLARSSSIPNFIRFWNLRHGRFHCFHSILRKWRRIQPSNPSAYLFASARRK